MCSGCLIERGGGLRYMASIVDYRQWWHAVLPYAAPNVGDAEPYYIANTEDYLAFDERYLGYGADKAEQFHRVMLAGYNLSVSPTWYILHAHLAEDTAQSVWLGGQQKTDETAEHWRAINLELYNALKQRWPQQQLLHPNNFDWRAIFPDCILSQPAAYAWALGAVDQSDSCRASLATWGNCQPKQGRAALCGNINVPLENNWTCPEGVWKQGMGWVPRARAVAGE